MQLQFLLTRFSRQFLRAGLSLVLLAICGLAFSQASNRQSLVSLSGDWPGVKARATKAVPTQGNGQWALARALEALELRHDVSFVYETKFLAGKRVTINHLDLDRLEESLRTLTRPHGLVFERIDPGYYLIEPAASPRTGKVAPLKKLPETRLSGPLKPGIESQELEVTPSRAVGKVGYYREKLVALERSVSGTVTGADGLPIIGANVRVKNSSVGTITDVEGRFELLVPDEARTLVVSYLGFRSREINITSASEVSITLEEDNATLSEVVVVGYGTQKRSDLTGSISSVSAEELETLPLVSIDQGLQGKAAGVQVRQTSGAPGSSISIRIRGGNSITGGNEPLYVIDGFPVVNSAGSFNLGNPGQTNGRTNSQNPLAALNPNDIESIEVLKDASATAIYGARGANGVVLITTKRGSVGQSNIDFEAYYGVQDVDNTTDVLSGPQYAVWANEWAANTGADPIFNNPANATDTDWQEEVYETAPMQNYNIGFSGGSQALRYAISGGYFNQEGVIKGSDFERFSLRVNLDSDVKDWLKVGNSLSVSRTVNNARPSDNDFSNNGSIPYAAMVAVPTFPVFDENGNYFFIDRALIGDSNEEAIELPNPVSLTTELDDERVQDRLLGNVFAEITLAEGLRFRSSLGADIFNGERRSYFTRNTLVGGLGNNGQASIASRRLVSILNENTLNYDVDFGAGRLGAVAGFTWQTENAQSSSIANSNFVTDILGANDIQSGAQEGGPIVNSGRSKWQLASFLGRVNYTLRDRYLFTFSGRADGSSRFGTNNKWAFFPSGAFAWRLSQEPFLADNDFIDNLKLRVSYGVTGNQEIGLYRSLTRLGTTIYTFNGQQVIGFFPAGVANPDLKWETTEQLDLGIDFAVLEGRIALSFDYYDKHTDDLLLNATLPFEAGFGSVIRNTGEVSNRGFEIGLNGRIINGPFQWSTGFNFTRNRNEVVSLGDSESFNGGGGLSTNFGLPGLLVEVGQPLGVFFGYEVDGAYNDQADIEASGGSDARVPGDEKVVDTNGDGVINAMDRVILGSPQPDFFFGWTNNFSFGGFNLSVFINGVQGNEVLNLNRIQLYGSGIGTNVAVDRFENRWTPDNPDAALPRAGSISDAGGNNNIRSYWIEDGSFIRLQNVTLGYDIPAATLPWLRSARVYLSGQNLVTWTDYSGSNPETNNQGQNNINQGIDLGAYPLPRVVTFGVKLGL